MIATIAEDYGANRCTQAMTTARLALSPRRQPKGSTIVVDTVSTDNVGDGSSAGLSHPLWLRPDAIQVPCRRCHRRISCSIHDWRMCNFSLI